MPDFVQRPISQCSYELNIQYQNPCLDMTRSLRYKPDGTLDIGQSLAAYQGLLMKNLDIINGLIRYQNSVSQIQCNRNSIFVSLPRTTAINLHLAGILLGTERAEARSHLFVNDEDSVDYTSDLINVGTGDSINVDTSNNYSNHDSSTDDISDNPSNINSNAYILENSENDETNTQRYNYVRNITNNCRMPRLSNSPNASEEFDEYSDNSDNSDDSNSLTLTTTYLNRNSIELENLLSQISGLYPLAIAPNFDDLTINDDETLSYQTDETNSETTTSSNL